MAALYKGFTTTIYGICNGGSANVSFALSDVALIQQDILNHIMTRRGTRVMQPTFGTIIPDLLFEPFDDTTISLIEEEVVRVIKYDPRVSINNLTVTPNYDTNTVTFSLELLFVELNVIQGMDFNIEFS